jgi:hypothetical protein
MDSRVKPASDEYYYISIRSSLPGLTRQSMDGCGNYRGLNEISYSPVPAHFSVPLSTWARATAVRARPCT